MAENDIASAAAPDPTPRTLESQAQALAWLKESLGSRIDSLRDQLEQFRSDLMTFPTRVDQQVGALDKILQERGKTVEERFRTVQVQFDAIEKAITTALNAAAAMSAQLNTSNAAAITKAEQGMSGQINALEALLRVEVNSLRAGVADNSSRISTIVDRNVGKVELRETSQGNQIQLVGVVGLVVAILFGSIGAFLGIMTTRSDKQERIIERVVEVAPSQRAPTIVIPAPVP